MEKMTKLNKKLKRKRKHGFLKKSRGNDGLKTIKNRRASKRKKLTA